MVKTMKGIAAVNIHQYERAVVSLEEYRGVVDMGWQALFRYSRPVSEKTPGRSAVCLVIGSDQGMCGQFNEALMSRVMEESNALRDGGVEVAYWGLGEKVQAALEDRGFTPGLRLSLPGSLKGIHFRVQTIVQGIAALKSDRGPETFYISHNILLDAGGFEPLFYRLLPLDQAWAKARGSKKWPGRCLPLMGLAPEDLFSHLFHQYLIVSFYRAIAQSLAGENAARLMAMQAAEKNILEMQDELSALFREQRQAGITNELLDIMAGFEALGAEVPTV